MHVIPGPNFTPGYFANEMRMTFKSELQPQFQSSACQVNSPKSTNVPAVLKQSVNTNTGTSTAGSNLNATQPPAHPKLLPPNLLREPLSPEQF